MQIYDMYQGINLFDVTIQEGKAEKARPTEFRKISDAHRAYMYTPHPLETDAGMT